MKQKGWLLILLAFCLLLSGCGKNDELVEEEAGKLIAAFEAHDYYAVTEAVFGVEMKDSEKEGESYFIRDLLERDSVELKKIKKDTVIFAVTAPNMENVLQDYLKEETNINGKTLEAYLNKRATSSETVTVEVEVPYTVEDKTVQINYRNSEFMNALTGGYTASYQKVYETMTESMGLGGEGEEK